MQQGLVESGLELVGHDQEALFGRIEVLGRLRLRESVHTGLGVVPTAILDGAGECQARPGYDLRLRPAADPILHAVGEVLHHDAHLLPDGVRVQFHERPQQIGGLVLVVARVVGDRLPQPPIRLIGGVVLQHVQDGVLFDCLPHAVEVVRAE